MLVGTLMRSAVHSRFRLVVVAFFLSIFGTFSVASYVNATGTTAGMLPADAAQRRRDSLLSTLTTDSSALVTSLRKGCVRGVAVKAVREAWARGNYWTPDAVDECVTILTRHGRDGTLDALYRTILLAEVGNDAGAEKLAGEIAGAVMEGKRADLPLARALSLKISTALAFDAGFTNGYRDTGKSNADVDQLPGEAALKPLAERCLDLKDATNDGCYSAGYVYGLRAARGALVAAAR